MDSRETTGDGRDRELDHEIERYRRAALHALDQLGCINYLHRIRKPDLAKAIARNRKQIMEQIRTTGGG
jgi:hypothetical protein